MTALQKKDLDVSNYQNSQINGTVEMEQDGYLFTSIPFDSGFTVWVDGEKAEYTAFSDTFLLLPLSAGTHEIRTSHVPRGFLAWICIDGFVCAFAGGVGRVSIVQTKKKPAE